MGFTVEHRVSPFLLGPGFALAAYRSANRERQAIEAQQTAVQRQNQANAIGQAIGNVGTAFFQARAIKAQRKQAIKDQKDMIQFRSDVAQDAALFRQYGVTKSQIPGIGEAAQAQGLYPDMPQEQAGLFFLRDQEAAAAAQRQAAAIPVINEAQTAGALSRLQTLGPEQTQQAVNRVQALIPSKVQEAEALFPLKVREAEALLSIQTAGRRAAFSDRQQQERQQRLLEGGQNLMQQYLIDPSSVHVPPKLAKRFSAARDAFSAAIGQPGVAPEEITRMGNNFLGRFAPQFAIQARPTAPPTIKQQLDDGKKVWKVPDYNNFLTRKSNGDISSLALNPKDSPPLPPPPGTTYYKDSKGEVNANYAVGPNGTITKQRSPKGIWEPYEEGPGQAPIDRETIQEKIEDEAERIRKESAKQKDTRTRRERLSGVKQEKAPPVDVYTKARERVLESIEATNKTMHLLKERRKRRKEQEKNARTLSLLQTPEGAAAFVQGNFAAAVDLALNPNPSAKDIEKATGIGRASEGTSKEQRQIIARRMEGAINVRLHSINLLLKETIRDNGIAAGKEFMDDLVDDGGITRRLADRIINNIVDELNKHGVSTGQAQATEGG